MDEKKGGGVTWKPTGMSDMAKRAYLSLNAAERRVFKMRFAEDAFVLAQLEAWDAEEKGGTSHE